MKTPLDCPVCNYKEIDQEQCPNCDTDVSLLRLLVELPSASEEFLSTVSTFKTSRSWKYLNGLMFVLLLAITSFSLSKWLAGSRPQPVSQISPSSPVLTSNPEQTKSTKPQTNIIQGFTYTVTIGDTLTNIGYKFYHDPQALTIILESNPQLRGREDLIQPGEKLLITNQ